MRAPRKQLKPTRSHERGATLVEYVLIVAVLVGGSLVAVRYLTSEGSAEVASQADCVATRPPPQSCLRPVLTTTTTVVTPSTSTTEAPTTTTTAAPTTTTTAPAGTTTTTAAPTTTTTTAPARQWEGDARFDNDVRPHVPERANGQWYFRVDISLDDARGYDDTNVVVEVRYTITDPVNGGTGVVTCTTDGNGDCLLRVPGGNSSFAANVNSVRIEFVTIDGMRAPNGADVDTVNKT